MTIVSIINNTNNKKQPLVRAFFWYLFALSKFVSAPLVSCVARWTLSLTSSSCPPCSCTIWATSRNSSLSSPTLCSIFRISLSRSIIRDSWKSTSSWGARRDCCSCSCCRFCPSCSAVLLEPSSSIAVLAAFAEARCFSNAWRWTAWNLSITDWNSLEIFCCVHFWDGYNCILSTNRAWLIQ